MSLAFTVNTEGCVYQTDQSSNGHCLNPPGATNLVDAFELGVGGQWNTVWAVLPYQREKTGTIAWFDNSLTNPNWQYVAPASEVNAVKVSVGPDGTAYVVTNGGEVVHVDKNGVVTPLSPAGEFFAQDIGVGTDGSVWIISIKTIKDSAGSVPAWLDLNAADPTSTDSWHYEMSASASAIDVGPDGSAYTVNTKGEVWITRKNSTTGQRISPPDAENFAADIGIGASAVPWVVTQHPREGGGAIIAFANNIATCDWTELGGKDWHAGGAAAVRIAAT